MKKMLLAIWADPAAKKYSDIAITAPGEDELSLGIYQTRGMAEALESLPDVRALMLVLGHRSIKEDGQAKR